MQIVNTDEGYIVIDGDLIVFVASTYAEAEAYLAEIIGVGGIGGEG